MSSPGNSERLIPLAGGRNFRDLGGYATQEGRTVRWKQIFRSGTLAFLTASDHSKLASLKVRMVCDLRTARERSKEPTNWPDPTILTAFWNYDPKVTSLHGLRSAVQMTAEKAQAAIISLYRQLPAALTSAYSGMFQHLATSELAMVIHCSAGKDRTGLASALVLLAVGVPRDQVVSDYVLTDSAVDLEKELFTHRNSSFGVAEEDAFLHQLDPEVRRPLLAAREEYLHAALDQITQDYGSVDGYLKHGLGVVDEVRTAVKRRLLK